MSPSENAVEKSSPVRQPVLLGLFTGTAVGVGYLLAGVPNIELMTLTVVLCGGVMGCRAGFAAGAVAAVIYSLGSPFGLPVPQMLLAQAVGLGWAGVAGAVGGNRVLDRRLQGSRLPALLWAGAIGLGSTLIYDLLTNLAIVWAFELNARVVLFGAVPFAVLHVVSNTVICGALLPLLLPRLAGLRRQSLVGRQAGSLVILLVLFGGGRDVLAASTAAGDSVLAAAPVDSLPEASAADERPHGWQRPLWTPFPRTALEWLQWYSNRVPVRDGGLGASTVILGEAGTSWNPLVLRDGIPVGTGHVLADDPGLIPTAGLALERLADGADGRGGTGGVLSLQTADTDPGRAISSYRGVKGKHESYFRSIHLLTPRAAWRVAFEFEESLDKEAYNYSDQADELFVGASSNPFPGHSRIRQSRTRLTRELTAGNKLSLAYSNGRLTKDGLPALGAEHLELWDDGVAASMTAGWGDWQLATNLFWRDRDVIWGDRAADAALGAGLRELETGREGVDLTLSNDRDGEGATTGLVLQATNWQVDDTLSDAAELVDFSGPAAGSGQTGRAEAHLGYDLGGTQWRAASAAVWQSWAGWGPEVSLQGGAAGSRPWWSVEATYGGRAPRSDELLTPLVRDVAGRRLLLLPNGDLRRERTARLGLALQFRLLGLDLAVDGSARRLRDGITWRALAGNGTQGRWQNDLALNSRRITGSVAREGRWLGWGRIRLEGTWQQSDEIEGRAAMLPPRRYLRSTIQWENHFFEEDGILQVALFSTVRDEMADPWDVTRSARLPARTVHDLLVGFRLVGANLSLAFRNLTGARTRLTSGAMSGGQEVDMRLEWGWVY